MEYDVSLMENIDFAPDSTVKEILQNVRTILDTVVGAVPLERNIGVSWDYVGKPLPVAMDLLRVAVKNAITEQEPRARIVSIKFEEIENDVEFAEQGILKPRVRIYIEEQGG